MFSKIFHGTENEIQSQTNVFEGLEFEECFNRDKLAVILMDMSKIDSMRRANARNQVCLKKYMEDHFQNRDGSPFDRSNRIKYKQSSLLGRQQAQSSSAQGMLREARHFIFDQYVDVDMKNAHPNIILYICKILNIEFKSLDMYVNDRENIIQKSQAFAHDNNEYHVTTDDGDRKIDREFFKQYFLAIIYGCGRKRIENLKNRHEFIEQFSNEVQDVSKLIMDKFPKFLQEIEKQRKSAGKDYNLYGSALSHLCQVFEAYLLQEMFIELQSIDSVNCLKTVLAFDGMMIHKDCFKSVSVHDFIQRCEARISLDFFKLELKDMSVTHDQLVTQYSFKEPEYPGIYLQKFFNKEIYDFIEEQKLVAEESFYFRENQDYIDSFMKSVNHIWPSVRMLEAYIKAHSPKYFVKILDGQSSHFVLNISSEKYICKQLPDWNLQYFYTKDDKVKFKTEPLQQFILRSIVMNDIKSYASIESHPFNDYSKPECPANVFNAWSGYQSKEVEVTPSEGVQAWLSHIKLVLCNEDEDQYEYLLTWLKQLFKHPNRKTKRVLLFKSEQQQIGKGLFWQDFLSELVIGRRYAKTRFGLSWLVSKFNGQFKESILNILEEASGIVGDSYHAMFDNFKSYTTEKYIEIDEKYMNPRNVVNNNNFVILSNNDQPVKIEANDSRFVLFDCNESKFGDLEYFSYLAKFLDQKTANEFFSYVINRQHVGHVLNQPKSDYYKEVQQLSLNNSIRFIQHCREQVNQEDDNSPEAAMLDMFGSANKDDSSIIYINRTKLYNGYSIWCKDHGEKPCKAALFYKIITQSDCDHRIVRGDRQVIMKNMMLYSQC